MTDAELRDAGPPLSVEEARALFPGLANTTYLATNGQALLPSPTRDRLAAGIDDLMARGFAASAALDANVERVRGQVARLLGAEDREALDCERLLGLDDDEELDGEQLVRFLLGIDPSDEIDREEIARLLREPHSADMH